MERQQAKQIMAGLILMAIGFVFLGRRLDIVPVIDLHRLWPVFLVLAGAVRLTVRRKDGGRSGYGLVLIGGIFLLHTYRVWSIQQSWPLFIVAAGLTLIAEQIGQRPSRPSRTEAGGPQDQETGR